MIHFDQISVIIQGPYNGDVTNRVIASVRNCLPGTVVIFSTCDADLPGKIPGCDQVIVSPDPGVFLYGQNGVNNINRQIVNTLAGLTRVRTPFAMKLRSDFAVSGHDFLNFFDSYPESEKKYQVFSHKLLSCCYFSRNPREGVPFPFHPSDLMFFGKTDDLLKLFDIPLMTKEEAYWDSAKLPPFQYWPEQYVFINCLRKNHFPCDCDFLDDCRPENVEQTERYFASNFIFLDFSQFNLVPQVGGFSMETDPKSFESCYTHVEWLRLYRDYVDPQLQVPMQDQERESISNLLRTYRRKQKTLHCLINILVLPLPGNLRKHARRKMMTLFMK